MKRVSVVRFMTTLPLKALLSIFCAASLLGISVSASAQDRGLKVVARELAGSSNFEVGRQIAVVIGVDKYQNWLPLKNAVSEAKEFKRILAENYYFDEFIELYDQDATVTNIRRLFSQVLPSKVGVRDSVLIFYAGHGFLDDSKSGFWIPVDGGTDQFAQAAWLPNAQLRNYLGQLKSQRLLVIADSCFSGDLLNTSRGALPTIDSAYFKNAIQLTSRQVLSSGASETVPDESEFARQLLGYLERNNDPVIDTLSIYERIRRGVTRTLPLYGTLPGNEQGSSYVFFKKQKEQPVQPKLETVKVAYAVPKSDYMVRLRPADQPDAAFQTLGTTVELNPGTYTVVARLPNDVQDTWTGTLTIKAGKPASLNIPTLDYSKPYQINQLMIQRTTLQTQAGIGSLSTTKVLGFVSLGLGVVGAVVGIGGVIDGSGSYQAYNSATSASAATSGRARAEVSSALATVSFPLGALFLGAAPFLLSVPEPQPDPRYLEQIRQIDQKIQALSQN